MKDSRRRIFLKKAKAGPLAVIADKVFADPSKTIGELYAELLKEFPTQQRDYPSKIGAKNETN